MIKLRKRELAFLSLGMCQTLYVYYLMDSSCVLRLREVKWLPKVPCVVRSEPDLNPDQAGANAP